MTLVDRASTDIRGLRIASSTALGIVSAVSVPVSGLAYASNGGGNKPDCHGQNQVECRPDPQPTHGRDCERSDDHVCLAGPSTTTTTTTTTPTTAPFTPTTAPSTTITTLLTPPAPTGRPISTTATELPVSPTSPEAPVSVVTVSPSRPIELAHTGAETPILVGLGLALVVVGAALKRRFRD